MPPKISTSPLPQITLQAPLVSMDVACAALKQTRAEVFALIDNGQIGWAFNLALRSAAKAEVRILAESLADYQNGKRNALATAELSRVLPLIFPNVIQRGGVVATITASSLAERLSVSADHIFNTIKDGSLQLVRGTNCRRGPGGSPKILFASVETFLLARRRV